MPDTPDVRTVLAQVALFENLPSTTLDALAREARLKHLSLGEILFLEGSEPEGLHVIAEGAIKLFKTSETGREQILVVERRHAPIGEVPLFDGHPLPATAMAVEPATIIFIPRPSFERLTREHPEMTGNIVRVLARRLRSLINLVEELSLKEVSGRLARVLLEEADAVQPGATRPSYALRATNQELASAIGTVRELVSRTLGRFRDAGWIELAGRHITILDRAALEDEMARGKRG